MNTLKMQVIYEGKDIAGKIDVAGCIHRERIGGGCDRLEMLLEHAPQWYSWNPAIDDTLTVKLGNYSTGKLYINALAPTGGKYRLIAASVPSSARKASCASWEKKTLSAILAACAAESGMGCALYGVNGAALYPYLSRTHESPAAFAARILAWEGAALKTSGGRFAAIDLATYQAQKAVKTLTIRPEQKNATHIYRPDLQWSSIEVISPYGVATAAATSSARGGRKVIEGLPVSSAADAARFARGLLCAHNRLADTLTIETTFEPLAASMVCMDITGGTDADGCWLIDECEHDMILETTEMLLHRCE